jgi:hypothetical protein
MKTEKRVDIIEQQLALNDRLKDCELEAVVDLDENDKTFTTYYKLSNGKRELLADEREINELMNADSSISVEIQE